jgi:hypothetical protein
MSRTLQADVAALVQPMPKDFAPSFQDMGRYVRWDATLDLPDGTTVNVELGFSRAAGKVDENKERENLRASAWQTTELARLGRRDLLDYCVVGRHKRA